MTFKKKLSPAARAASVVKTILSAEKNAMQALAGWGKTTRMALVASEKNLAVASKKAGRIKTRAANALKRVKRAKVKEAKVIANNARKLVQAELISARDTLKLARESHAATKAAHKIFQLVEKGVTSGVKSAEQAAAKSV